MFKIYQGDALELFKNLENNSIDCIVTDPPYETISGGSQENQYVNRPSGILAKNDGKIFKYNEIDISNWISECYRVLKDGTHIYIMTNFLNLEHYLFEIRKAGFEIHNLLIWEKNNATPNRWYMKNCEYIIFGRKGTAKPINNCGSKTILKFANVKNRIHPTEKPIELLETLITNSSNPGDTVLDPFGGSMSTALASIKTGRNAISFEIDKDYYKTGLERLENFNPEDIKVIIPKTKQLTEPQIKILEILKNNPDKIFDGKQLSQLTGLTARTCSGCFTPLCSAGLIEKVNTKSPFKIKYKNK